MNNNTILNRIKVLDRNALKTITIIAMTMDHIAPILFKEGSVPYILFRMIGRLTFPTMAYMLADGFRYTHNLKKYITRMFWFSVVSWFTFSFLETGSLLPVQLLQGNVSDYAYSHLYLPSIDKTLCISRFSVLTSFLLAQLTLTVWEKTHFRTAVKALLTLLLLAVSLDCDWVWFSIPLTAAFYYLKDKKTEKWAVFALLSLAYIFNVLMPRNLFDLSSYMNIQFNLYRVGVFLVPIVIEFLYNGSAGKKTAAGKWFFYIFYPAHQLVLGILNLWI